MATSQFGLLEEREETELHKTRLLAVEERPFKRLTKRLVAPGVFTNPNTSHKLPTPPPDSSQAEGADTTAAPLLSPEEITALKEDITLDFAAFDSAIARLQFLATANADERTHYAASRARIQTTMEEVREHNGALRVRLSEARETLAQRRKFDELADKITGNRMLRTRAEQDVNLAKLAEECDELRRESEAYGDTWRERREQFERLVDEGRRLRALIRDEKEEVERREGMDSDAEDGEAGDGGGATPGPGGVGAKSSGLVSGNATPRHTTTATEGSGSAAGSKRGDSAGGATPRPGSAREDRTPRPESPGRASAAPDGEHPSGLKPLPEQSRNTPTPAPEGSSQQQEQQQESEEKSEDVEMSESATLQTQAQAQDADVPMVEDDVPETQETQETPQITVDAPVAAEEEKMDLT